MLARIPRNLLTSVDDEDDEDDDAGSIDGFEVGVETQNLIDSAQAQPIVVEDEEDEVVVEHEDEGWNRDVEVMEWPHDDDPSQPVTRPDAVDEPSVAQDSLLSSAPAPATTKRQRYPTWAVAPTWSEGNEDEIGEHAHQLVNDDDEVEGEDGMMEGDRSSGQELDEATRVVTGDLGAVPGLAEALEVSTLRRMSRQLISTASQEERDRRRGVRGGG